MTTDHTLEKIGELLDLMDRLRGPGGCPWDARQTPETLKPYLVEEAYELLEAIDQGEPTAICEELGDLLLQVVFHAAIFKERRDFTFGDVAQGIADKLRRRHPHVFADATFTDEAELHRQWEAIKSQEKTTKSNGHNILTGIPTALPPTQRAHKVIDRTMRAGLVWPEVAHVTQRAHEQLSAVTIAANSSDTSVEREELFGNLLFTMQLLAKQLQIDPDRALHRALSAFSQRLDDIATTNGHDTRLTEIDIKKLLPPSRPLT